MAKGQKRSGREPKKPKKTPAERLKASQAASERKIAGMSNSAGTGNKDGSGKG